MTKPSQLGPTTGWPASSVLGERVDLRSHSAADVQRQPGEFLGSRRLDLDRVRQRLRARGSP